MLGPPLNLSKSLIFPVSQPAGTYPIHSGMSRVFFLPQHRTLSTRHFRNYIRYLIKATDSISLNLNLDLDSCTLHYSHRRMMFMPWFFVVTIFQFDINFRKTFYKLISNGNIATNNSINIVFSENVGKNGRGERNESPKAWQFLQQFRLFPILF